MSHAAPEIGVLDSGLGGLTVLREIRRQMPTRSVLYLADTANVPYGDKPLEVVRDLALRLTDHLIKAGAQIVIMASGTSTVAGLDAARQHYPAVPILGTIEPGAETAVHVSDGVIGVLSTSATARSLAFTQAVHALDPLRKVVEQGCPRFVPLVETGQSETQEAEDAACEYLRPLQTSGVQTIILGCTHFPFLLPALHRAVRRFNDPAFNPLFVDPSEETVRCALPYLPAEDGATISRMDFAASGDPEDFRHYASLLLGEELLPVSSLSFY